MKAEERTKLMLDAAVKLAKKSGVKGVSRRAVAKACKCSESLVNVYLGNNADMQKKTKAYAKKSGVELPGDPKPVKKAVKAPVAKKAARKPKAAPISVPQLRL